MDCFNYSCPFRVNESSSLNRCECTACPNRYIGKYYSITWNKTLTKEEMDEIENELISEGLITTREEEDEYCDNYYKRLRDKYNK